jgi:hypothetical protein
MVAYRLYCLGGHGRPGHVETLEAPNDEDALCLARLKKPDVSCEVWDGDRLVGHIRDQSAEPPFA